jgi:hypothetical protein
MRNAMTTFDNPRPPMGPYQAQRTFEALPAPSRAALVALAGDPHSRVNPSCLALLRRQLLLDEQRLLTAHGRFVVANRPRRFPRVDVQIMDSATSRRTVTVELPGPREVLAAGVRWLLHTEQPDDAILQHHGVTVQMVVDNRSIKLFPRGWGGHPVIAVDVASQVRDEHGRLLTQLGRGELDVWQAVLTDLGVQVAHRWNGWPAPTGSLALAGQAHPSLLAAVDRYRAGCPDHPGLTGNTGVFCQCGWYQQGYEQLVRPTIRGAHGGAE